jgi:hypothetical protein
MKTFSRLLAISSLNPLLPLNPLKGTLPAHRISRHRAGINSPFRDLGGKNLVVLALMILLVTSCEKDPITRRCCDCERPATQQGANTMSFKINGEQWSNCNKTDDGSLNDFRTVMVQLPYGDYSRMDVWGGRNFESSARETFFIRIRNPKVSYITDSPSKQTLFGFETNQSTQYSTHYENDTTKAYFLNITKVDWDNRILSGEFECELKKALGSDPAPNLTITEGRFDVSF